MNDPPAGLTVVDWAEIRALYEKHRHSVSRQEDGSFVARNPEQHWRIRFDGRGFAVRPNEGDWSWGLELIGFGRAGALEGIEGKATATGEGRRVSYRWSAGLEEWFVNDTGGLEQGWTVRERPAGGDRLGLALRVRGDLRPETVEDGAAVHFLDDAGVAVVRYDRLRAWDVTGRTLPSRMAVAEVGGVRVEVDDRGARYPVTIDPVAVQTAYIKASNTGPSDQFGVSVALHGDTLAVGAAAEDSNGIGVNSASQADNSLFDGGAVYIFERVGGVWTQEAYIKASNTGADDRFGMALSLDGETLAVGAYGEDSNGVGVNPNAQDDNSAVGSGAVYVFQRTDGVWAQQAYIKASNTGANDRFGYAVSLSGDTLAVGASTEDSNGVGVDSGAQTNNTNVDSGAVYVFERADGEWAQQAYIKASNTDPEDYFGDSVALSGDTLAVGAYLEDSNGVGVNPNAQADNSASRSGAVYVFQRTSGQWSQQAYLKASNAGSNHFFGSSVSLAADTLAVGARNEPENGSGGSGAVYVFQRMGSDWAQEAYIKASNPERADQFGWSVALSADTLAVGAQHEDSNGEGVNSNAQANNSSTDSGAVYVFHRTDAVWAQRAYVKASNTGGFDRFGYAVALSGDTLAVGAILEDSNGVGVNSNSQANNSAADSGAAYLFALCPVTSTSIGSIWPSPSYSGQSYQVDYTVNNSCGDTILGTVSISDGEGSECTGPAPIGSCTLNSTTAGLKTITATYLGDGNFLPSSQTLSHTVTPAPTTTSITSIQPSPAALAQTYDVAYSVTSAGGSPTGSVTVTDGDAGNTCTVAAGVCPLTSLTPGLKTVTASYLGDSNFLPSSDAVSHAVSSSPTSQLGAFTNGLWFVDRNGDFAFDQATEISGWGSPGDVPVRGDWNGDGFRDLGVFSGGTWFLDRNGDAVFDPGTEVVGWGIAGWLPITGDWNGDGKTDIGAIDPATSTWFLDLNGDLAFDPVTEIRGWGSPGDTPVVGDWDGDGADEIGVFSGGTWFIDFNGDGVFNPATDQKGWGVAGWTPVVGDWNGDGADEIGAVSPDSAWFRDMNGDFAFDPATEILGWGSPGDKPLVADWNGDGVDDVGVFSGGTWFIDANGNGAFDPGSDIYGWGLAGWAPVPGPWK